MEPGNRLESRSSPSFFLQFCYVAEGIIRKKIEPDMATYYVDMKVEKKKRKIQNQSF
jgi:hypothetical protein